MNTKIIGFSPIYNEIECIEGWYNNIKEFCDEIWAIYDPRSDDGTNEYLFKLEKEGKIKLFKQNISVGDSMRTIRGIFDEITYLIEVNRFISENIKIDEWFLWLAADERIDPINTNRLRWMVDQADVNNFDGVVLDLYDMYPDEIHRVAYENILGELNHVKFVKRTHRLKYGIRAHDGADGHYKTMKSRIPFYHFGYIKSTKAENWWRKWDGLNNLNKVKEEERFIEVLNPFENWRKS
jgi:hypothetical protein